MAAKLNTNKMKFIAVMAVSITTTPIVMINTDSVSTRSSLVIKVMADNNPIKDVSVTLFGKDKKKLPFKTNRKGYAITATLKKTKGINEIKLDSGSYQLIIKKDKFSTRKLKVYLPEKGYVEKIIKLSKANHPPKSVAGEDVFIYPKTPVILDAKNSYDPDYPHDIDAEFLTEADFRDEFDKPNGKKIESFIWKIESKPDHSKVTIKKPTNTKIKITPDVEGDYDISLTTSDGIDTHRDNLRIKSYFPITPKKKLPYPRGGHASSIIGNYVYAIGGWNRVFLKRVDRFNIKENIWEPVAPLNIARNHFMSIAYQGKIYAIGGHNNIQKEGISEIERYDPVNNTWTIVSQLPGPRYSLDGDIYNGKIYIFGGTNAPKRVDVYDPFFNTWQKLNDMPTGRYRHSVNFYKGKFYLFGGKGTEKSVYEFDPETKHWSIKKPLPNPRYYHASAVYKNRIFVVGGHSFKIGEGVNTVEEYHPEKDIWRSLSSLPTAIDIHSMNAQENGIFIIGGEGQFGTTSVLTTNLIYNPLFAKIISSN